MDSLQCIAVEISTKKRQYFDFENEEFEGLQNIHIKIPGGLDINSDTLVRLPDGALVPLANI
jgi:hypothetical protein